MANEPERLDGNEIRQRNEDYETTIYLVPALTILNT